MDSLTPPDQNINSSKSKIFTIIVILILCLTVGTGVYLVSQRTNLLPKAITPITAQPPSVTSLSLEGGENSRDIASVSVKLNVEKDAANLIYARIKFPQDLLSVSSILTEASFLEASNSANLLWLDASFNNKTGDIFLLAAVPQPGVKTEASKKETLSKIYFRAKKAGGAELTFDNQSAVFRNLDNINILSEKPAFLLNIPEEIASNYEPECTQRPLCLDETPACKLSEPEGGYCKADKNDPSITLNSPAGGEIFNINSEVPIRWNASNLESLNILLLMNDSLFGKLAEVRADYGSFNWIPIQSLPVVYLNDQNTFKIEISSKDKTGEVIRDKSSGPFLIITRSDLANIATSSANLSETSVDFDGNSTLNMDDISILMSNFFLKVEDKKFDLNGDGNINGIDLYFMKNVLQTKGIINLIPIQD